jgi:hypothetical protein
MANTYFKYAERNAENRINWADVGKDMTDMLADEARVREEKKAAIETDFRDFSKTLADSPMGESQGFNEFTTAYADSAQEYSLMVNNMLKSGDLKLREYNNIQANLKQGTGEAFSIAEDYNKAYKGMLERGEINPETGLPSSQLLEQYVLGTVQGFGNYSDHRLWINPTTGKVSLGTTQTDKETGEVTMNRDTGSFIAVNALRNRTRAQYDIYDLNKVNAARVDTLGTTVDAVMSGGVKTVEDALRNENVVEVLDDFADSTVAIPTNVSSILTNSLGTNPNTGERYSFTDNPADAALDENLILIMDNPLQESAGLPMPAYLDSPEQLTEYLNKSFDDLSYTDKAGNKISHAEAVKQIVENNTKQLETAKDATKTSLVSMLDRKETTTAEFNNEKQRVERGQALKKTEQAVTNIADLYYGTEDEFNAALGFLQGLNPAVSRIYVDPDSPQDVMVEMRDKNGNITALEAFEKGDSVEQFVTSIVSTLVPNAIDVEKALDNSGIREDGRTMTSFTGASGESRKPMAPVIPTFDEKLDAEDIDSDTPSMIHDAEFGDISAREGEKLANAETSFFSQVGLTNAQVTYLDEAKINKGIVGSKWDNDAVQIMIPGVMTMPIIIPDNNIGFHYEKINRLILDAMRNGDLLTPNDFEEAIEDFAQYNNPTMADKVLGIEWNDGDGPQPLTEREINTATTTTDTSSY